MPRVKRRPKQFDKVLGDYAKEVLYKNLKLDNKKFIKKHLYYIRHRRLKDFEFSGR
jgi:hypothetical protein